MALHQSYLITDTVFMMLNTSLVPIPKKQAQSGESALGSLPMSRSAEYRVRYKLNELLLLDATRGF